MKRLFTPFILLTLSACTGQKQIDFKVLLKPETIYDRTNAQTIETVTTYSGSQDFSERLKAMGVSNPSKKNKSTRVEMTLSTGKLNSDNHFPLIMKIVDISDTITKKYLPVGTSLYGSCTFGNMPVLDSIGINGTDSEIKATMLKAMQNLFSQISFPEKVLQIGDTFSKALPFTMPIAGRTLNMDIITVYKLSSINGNIATLDITQNYTMKGTSETDTTYATTGSGGGKGQILYDINNNYYTKYQIDLTMKAIAKRKDYTLIFSTKSALTQTSSIVSK